jgi:hypothetical protein
MSELEEQFSLMLEYERNKYEYMFLSRQENLMSKVKNLIGIEIENIEIIAEHIPEKDRERIQKCIQRMWKQIAKLQEKECTYYDKV